MTFKQWVKEVGGTQKVAILLKTTYMRVWNWEKSRTTPSYLMMKKIEKMARGRVSVEQIVKETHVGRGLK